MTALLSVLLMLLVPTQPAASPEALWDAMARTVEAGDFEAYAALYHPDAVLVNAMSGDSYPIATALAGWKQGFDDTRDGKMTAHVEFRLTQKLVSESTAHHTGIFAYTSRVGDADPVTYIIHFEGLMVRMDGEWKLMMEYQKGAATPAEWEAAG